MRALLLSTTIVLTGCLAAQDDLDGYFDSVDPNPAIRVITPPPQNVQGASPQAVTTTPLDETQVASVDPNLTNGQTAEDRRVVNSGSNPPPEYVDDPVAAPTEPEKRSSRNTVSDAGTDPKPLGKRSQTIDLREYARTQRHLVGTKKYPRTASRYANGGNCDRYSIPEVAQTAFLSEGGPQRDKLLLDRDGDGFACSWTPDMAR